MILADTSAWVEFLRGTGSPTNRRLHELLRERGALFATDAVLMELLAGARDRAERESLRRLVARCGFIPTQGPGDYETAADIYHGCRRRGESIRSLLDCLIAAVAIRSGAALLHADTDFDAIGRIAPLRIA